MINAYSKSNLTRIIIISITACLLMVLIELIMQPSYWVKSILKLGIFLFPIMIYQKISHQKMKFSNLIRNMLK